MTGGAVEALRAAIDRELPAAVELRHRIHAAPQRSGEEGPTRDLVLAALPARHGVIRTAGTGAIVRVGGPGPAVGVRAELDALELDELTSVPWRSTNPGVMHACGHDVHLAALVALSRALDTVGGPVPLLAILQPREETYPSGALDIVEEGWLEQEHCFSTIGAHVQPHLPAGEVACTPGVVNASSDEFSIEVEGVGGHAAYPHLTRDPVLTLSDIVVSLQALVSRRADPMEPVVLSVTTLTAGTAANIVPGAATARGTVRAMEPAGRESLLNQMAEVVDFVARSHGCTAKLTLVSGEPQLTNHPALATGAASVLESLGLRGSSALRSAGSDDFSYFSERRPSLMLFVGSSGGADRLHSATFLPSDDRVRDLAYALLAGYIAAAQLRS